MCLKIVRGNPTACAACDACAGILSIVYFEKYEPHPKPSLFITIARHEDYSPGLAVFLRRHISMRADAATANATVVGSGTDDKVRSTMFDVSQVL